MRFKKGSRIEVFNEKIAPSGAWRCADIISGNGHTYSVKFVSSTSMMNGASAERVSRKNIRPCPPPVISAHTLTGGEMVEVFDDFSWKIATVLKRVGFGDFYLVRLLGSSREFQVPEDHVRVRQSWQDDNWFVIRKGSEFPRSGKISTSKWYHYSGADGKIDVRPGDNCLAVQNNTVYHESNAVSARTLKRVATFSASSAESCIGNSSKIRAVSEERLRQQTNPMLPNSMKKVDAVAYPRDVLGETYMHASCNNDRNEYYATGRGKSYSIVVCDRAGTSDTNDSDSDACSVGSCSVISHDQNEMSSQDLEKLSQDADTFSSDADSFYDTGNESIPLGEYVAATNHSPLSGESVVATVHRLELDAYRSTLEALYACGSLSWDQEALLTNLRISLNISNDEHLMELRNLISTGTSVPLGPVLEACMPCFQRSSDDFGVQDYAAGIVNKQNNICHFRCDGS